MEKDPHQNKWLSKTKKLPNLGDLTHNEYWCDYCKQLYTEKEIAKGLAQRIKEGLIPKQAATKYENAWSQAQQITCPFCNSQMLPAFQCEKCEGRVIKDKNYLGPDFNLASRLFCRKCGEFYKPKRTAKHPIEQKFLIAKHIVREIRDADQNEFDTSEIEERLGYDKFIVMRAASRITEAEDIEMEGETFRQVE